MAVLFTKVAEKQSATTGYLVLSVIEHSLDASLESFLSILLGSLWYNQAFFFHPLARVYNIRCTLAGDITHDML